MKDDHAIRFRDRLEDRLFVERQNGSEIDDLDAHAILRELLGRFVRDVDHRAPRDDRQVLSTPPHVRFSDRHDVVLLRQIFFDAPVEKLVLDVEDRIVVANRGFEQAFCVVSGSRKNDLQTRPVHEHRLRA